MIQIGNIYAVGCVSLAVVASTFGAALAVAFFGALAIFMRRVCANQEPLK